MMHPGLLLLIIQIYIYTKSTLYFTSYTSICNDYSLSKNNGLFDNTQEAEKSEQRKVFLVRFYKQYGCVITLLLVT